jgi:hypothetical protein
MNDEKRTKKLTNAFKKVRMAFKRAWEALVAAVFRGRDPKDVTLGKKVGVAVVGSVGVLLLIVTLIPAMLWGLCEKGVEKVVEDIPVAEQVEEVPAGEEA